MIVSSFLSGMLAASTLAQVAIGAFFVLAYSLGRREGEYLLFGLLCFTLAVATAGISYAYGAHTDTSWVISTPITHTGAIAAAALNLHFVMRYARRREGTAVAIAAYVLGGAYEVFLLSGHWWKAHSPHVVDSSIFGYSVAHVAATPTPIATSFYAVAIVELAASVAVLYMAYRAGRREALISLVGGIIVMATVVNDTFLVAGRVASVFLLPQGFLVYAFAVGSTLVLRYRQTAGELEVTATNLRERTEELRHSHAELRQMQDELVKKQQLAAVGELAAAIAHEVRNPLAVIVNAVAGLRRRGLREEDHHMLLGIVDEETARLNRLVTDLLRFARPVTVKRSAVSTSELARRSGELGKSGYDVEVHVADDPDIQTVWVDPGLFRLVLDNLVENAFQAMPGGGVVRIDVKREVVEGTPYVRLEVQDSGHGMDERVRERAINPFFTTRPSGTGLGLPIVERILEAHGGWLEIDSQPARGTSIGLFVPLGAPADPGSGSPKLA